MKRSAPSLFLIFSLPILFSSCGNFFNADTLKQEVEKRVTYTNAPSMNIRIISDEGIISPSGDLKKKVTDKTPITFVPFNGFQFIKWQLIDRATGKIFSDDEASEIIEFQDLEKSDTSFTVKKLNDNLWIKPLVADRPQVLTNIPFYKPSGDFINTTIKIIFGNEMDESSIYFSGEELANLGVTDLADIFYDNLRAPTSIEEITKENRVYGYTGNDGQKHYKNISINNNKNGENLLEHFEAPRFIMPETLIIPVNNENPPQKNSTIIVSVKNFYYTLDDKKIIMNEEFKWGYTVNFRKETSSPYSLNTTDAPEMKLLNPDYSVVNDYWIQTYENMAIYYDPISLTDKKLYIRGSITDSGSGLEQYFKLTLKDIETDEIYESKMYYYNGMYKVRITTNNHGESSETIYDSCTLGSTATEPRIFDFSDYPDGTYLVILSFFDCTNNESNKYIKIQIGG